MPWHYTSTFQQKDKTLNLCISVVINKSQNGCNSLQISDILKKLRFLLQTQKDFVTFVRENARLVQRSVV